MIIFSFLAASLKKIAPACNVLLCGDFNLPLIDWTVSLPTSTDRSSSSFCDILKDFSLSQLVKDPTRGSHILDLLLVNDPNLVSCLQLCDNLPGTDHDAVFFKLSVLPPKQESVHRVLYNYKKTDFDTFRASLSSIHGNWLSLRTLICGGMIGRINFLLLFHLMFLWFAGEDLK